MAISRGKSSLAIVLATFFTVFCGLASALLPTLAAAEPAGIVGEFANETVKVANVTREYRLVVPKTVNLSNPAPLVVAFHGMLIDSKDLEPIRKPLAALALATVCAGFRIGS